MSVHLRSTSTGVTYWDDKERALSAERTGPRGRMEQVKRDMSIRTYPTLPTVRAQLHADALRQPHPFTLLDAALT